MNIKEVIFPDGSVVNILLDEKHTFLVALSILPGILGAEKVGQLAAILRTSSFQEGIHYLKHRKGDLSCYRSMKPGSYYVTRSGLAALSSHINTVQSRHVCKWTLEQTYERLTGKSETAQLINAILMDITEIQAPDIRHKLREKIKKLEKYL